MGCLAIKAEAKAKFTVRDIKAMLKTSNPEEQLIYSEKIFKAMDINHDGLLDVKEMKALLNVFRAK